MKFYQCVYSRYKSETKFLYQSTDITLLQICEKIAGNNPIRDLVNTNTHTKFGQFY